MQFILNLASSREKRKKKKPQNPKIPRQTPLSVFGNLGSSED